METPCEIVEQGNSGTGEKEKFRSENLECRIKAESLAENLMSIHRGPTLRNGRVQ